MAYFLPIQTQVTQNSNEHITEKGETNPLGSCLNSVFFLLPAVQTKPSSLHRLQGDSPSHYSGLVTVITFPH
jgi:hypothetical protein